MLGDVNKFFAFKSLLTMPSNVFPLHLKQTLPHIIWIFNEGEGDEIEFWQPFKIFSTLYSIVIKWTLYSKERVTMYFSMRIGPFSNKVALVC